MSYVTAITGDMPSRTDTPEEFSNLADALIGSLPTFQSQINTIIDETNASVAAVEADRVSVVVLKSDTQGIYDDTVIVKNDAITAKTQSETARDLAEDYRDSAFVAAAAAAAAAGLPSLGGHAGDTLTVRPDESGVEFTPSARLDSIVVLTSGISWVCPSEINRVKLIMSGGGGSGAASGASNTCGGDGAGAGTIIAVFPVTAGQTYSYTVGAGGAGVDGSGVLGTPVSGNAGGSSTFIANGITYTAGGGGGGKVDTISLASGGAGSGDGSAILYGQDGVTSGFLTSSGVGGGYSALGKSGTRGTSYTGSTATATSGKIILELYK